VTCHWFDPATVLRHEFSCLPRGELQAIRWGRQKDSVHNVHTFGLGLACTAAGLGTGADSACFRHFPAITRPGIAFESHLGPSVSSVQGFVGL
jgi:hypothetical protein